MEMIKKLFKNDSFVYFAKNWKKANWSMVFRRFLLSLFVNGTTAFFQHPEKHLERML